MFSEMRRQEWQQWTKHILRSKKPLSLSPPTDGGRMTWTCNNVAKTVLVRQLKFQKRSECLTDSCSNRLHLFLQCCSNVWSGLFYPEPPVHLFTTHLPIYPVGPPPLLPSSSRTATGKDSTLAWQQDHPISSRLSTRPPHPLLPGDKTTPICSHPVTRPPHSVPTWQQDHPLCSHPATRPPPPLPPGEKTTPSGPTRQQDRPALHPPGDKAAPSAPIYQQGHPVWYRRQAPAR